MLKNNQVRILSKESLVNVSFILDIILDAAGVPVDVHSVGLINISSE
jgi:hypothetical protein